MKIQKVLGSYSGRMEDFRIRDVVACDRCEKEKPRDDDDLWFQEVCPGCQTNGEKRIVKRQLLQAAKWNRSHIRRHMDAVGVLENRAIELEKLAHEIGV